MRRSFKIAQAHRSSFANIDQSEILHSHIASEVFEVQVVAKASSNTCGKREFTVEMNGEKNS